MPVFSFVQMAAAVSGPAAWTFFFGVLGRCDRMKYQAPTTSGSTLMNA